MSDSLLPQGLQHARLPWPSLFPGACSNSGPLSWWCHPTVSSSASSFSFCLQSFPASGSFPVSQLSISSGQVLDLQPHHQSLQWIFIVSFRTDWFDVLAVQRTLKSLLQHHSLKASILWCSAFLYGLALTSIHDDWKHHGFGYTDLD